MTQTGRVVLGPDGGSLYSALGRQGTGGGSYFPGPNRSWCLGRGGGWTWLARQVLVSRSVVLDLSVVVGGAGLPTLDTHSQAYQPSLHLSTTLNYLSRSEDVYTNNLAFKHFISSYSKFNIYYFLYNLQLYNP